MGRADGRIRHDSTEEDLYNRSSLIDPIARKKTSAPDKSARTRAERRPPQRQVQGRRHSSNSQKSFTSTDRKVSDDYSDLIHDNNSKHRSFNNKTPQNMALSHDQGPSQTSHRRLAQNAEHRASRASRTSASEPETDIIPQTWGWGSSLESEKLAPFESTSKGKTKHKPMPIQNHSIVQEDIMNHNGYVNHKESHGKSSRPRSLLLADVSSRHGRTQRIPECSSALMPEKSKDSIRQYGSSVSSDEEPEDLKVMPSMSLVWEKFGCALRLLVLIFGFFVVYYVSFSNETSADSVIAEVQNILDNHSSVNHFVRHQDHVRARGQADDMSILTGLLNFAKASTQPRSPITDEAKTPVIDKKSDGKVEANGRNKDPSFKPFTAATSEIIHPGKTKPRVKTSSEEEKESNESPASSDSKSENHRKTVNGEEVNDVSNAGAIDFAGLSGPQGHGLRNSFRGKEEHPLALLEMKQMKPDSESRRTQTGPAETSIISKVTGPTNSDRFGPDSTRIISTREDAKMGPRNVISGKEPNLNSGFEDINPRDVGEGQYPILNWHYQNIVDPTTTKQFFALGRGDHVSTMKPACIFPETDKFVVMNDIKVCSGVNRTQEWLVQYCSSVEEAFDKESLLQYATTELGGKSPKMWISDLEASNNIVWVEGLTVLQLYDRSCGNIAHFAGRALFLQHVLDNFQAYAAPPHNVENVLILPNVDVMKRFRHPHNYGYWHKTLLRAIIAPASYTFGTLGNFLYRTRKVPFDGVPRVQFLHNLSLDGSNLDAGKVVCFRRMIVPSFLKSRFFVDDVEYPSTKPSLQSHLSGAPAISRDAVRLRERVSALLRRSPAIKTVSKRVIFLDRGGSRRVIPPLVRERLFHILEAAAKAKGYSFEIVTFNDMTFAQQVAAVEDAGVAIGVHGANLVNTIFMPPLSVLFELFPYKFTHGMYVNGGAAGLKYYSYQMSTGIPYASSVPFRDAEQCIRFDHKCKIHYRDADLQIGEVDMTAIKSILDEAIEWCELVREGKSSVRLGRRRLASIRKNIIQHHWSARQAFLYGM